MSAANGDRCARAVLACGAHARRAGRAVWGFHSWTRERASDAHASQDTRGARTAKRKQERKGGERGAG